MRLYRTTVAASLALAASASFAGTAMAALDASTGSAHFARDTSVVSLLDTHTFTLGASGHPAGAFTGNRGGTDANEFHWLPVALPPAGGYPVPISGENSPTQPSHPARMSASAEPELQGHALLLASLGAIGFLAHRRRRGRRDI